MNVDPAAGWFWSAADRMTVVPLTPATVVPAWTLGPVTDIPTVSPLVDGNDRTTSGDPDGANGSRGAAGLFIVSEKKKGCGVPDHGLPPPGVGTTNDAIVPAGIYVEK